ncbi:hypothetical protein HD806DRAFT_520484 [Xylariaceae sp. AK1471]|nr:hypothetical protein HD806DRAFT_520484 [Xylariaceae sp. AK1471]
MASNSGAPQPPQQPTEQPSLPLSPWAARFGIGRIVSADIALKRDNVQHSGFAPERKPSLDPVFYGDELTIENSGIFKSGNDIDRLFISEEDQKFSLKGIKPWQLGPLNRAVFFSDRGIIPGGHIRALNGEVDYHKMIYETERIKVDESTWLPLFRKDRWFDFNSVEPLLGGRSWSVDIPEVWDTIRTSIELANRILLALINDQNIFLQTLMYGKLGWWREAADMMPVPMPAPYPKATVLLSYPYFKQLWEAKYPTIPCNQDILMTLTPANWRNRFERLTAGQEWSFISGKAAEGIEGITFGDNDNVICLSTRVIVSLLKGNLTLAERCHGQFLLTRTLLNMLLNYTAGHAIINVRMMDPDPAYNLLYGENVFDEPYVDFAGAAELGFACKSNSNKLFLAA